MHVGPPISQDLTTDTSQSPRSNSSGHNNASAEKSMTVRIPQIPRRVCGKLPLCDHPDRDPHVRASGLRYYKEPNVLEGFAESSPCGSIRPWNCPVTLSNTALISHHTMTMTTEPRQSPRSHSSECTSMQSMTVAIQRILEKEYPGPELIRNHQTYRKGLQRAPLVGASGLGIVLSHQTNPAHVTKGFAESSPCGSIRPWNCPVTLSNTALISHHTRTMTTEPRQSPRSHSSECNRMQSMTVAIQRILEKEYPGPELIRNHQTYRKGLQRAPLVGAPGLYRKGLQRAPLVGASGPGIVLSHQTNLALISHHTMTREPRQSPRSNSSGNNDATTCNR
jgi:hypothetical protein